MGETEKQYSLQEIRKKIYSMILPITIEGVLQLTAGLVSMALIGRISSSDPTPVNAISISSRITQIVWALFKGITTGASVFVAQAYGSGNYKKLKGVIQQTLLSSILLVIIFQQIIYWNASAILSIFNPGPELLENGVLFLKTISWGLPFMVIMLVVAASLQGMGNAKTPMLIALTMNLINIVISYLLIFGNLGMPSLGIKGAAIATATAQFIGALIGLYVLFSKGGVLNTHVNKNFFKINMKQIREVYKVGFPTSLESIFWQVAAIILTKAILTFGDTQAAAHQMGLQAEAISYVPAAGFGIAATTFIGQALGSKNSKLGKAYLKETLKGTLWVTAFCASILIFLPKVVMAMLTENTEVINLGAKYLIIMGLVQVPQNISGVLNGALRGAGFTRVPMFVAAAGLWGIRVPLTLLFAYKFHSTIVAIWIIMGVDLIVRFILSFIIYKTKNIYDRELVFKEEPA
ncbi:MATE family efflux transporter [Clostridium swellfunianum]|uniref:MATE family efflux transporter n=1 Tax=Clostridium swellfunianum TaxID=1367462 RepID=UPI00202EB41A|nr:MATE family efflux transporter [Clostridium swellfunianum]MCM0649703.1 MATE family efflux transporter [Clostridium swellfunianum]